MNKVLRSCAVLAAVAAPLAAAPAADAASATPSSRHIVGGAPATQPGIVQLSFGQNGGTYGCTGELISDEWVLTAQHCTDGDDWMNVYFSNSTSNRGPAHAVDRFVNSPSGDVALVHLAKPASGKNALPLANSYSPRRGDSGTIYGYGLRADRQPSPGLYKASVNVLGESRDAYNGRAVHVQGVSGASNHGDSGGPLIVNGEVVAVCSTGDSADPGADTNARSNYANLTDSRRWIKNVTGV